MKRKATLTSKGDYASVKITIELDGKFIGRDECARAIDGLTASVATAICASSYTGAAYPHQVKVR